MTFELHLTECHLGLVFTRLQSIDTLGLGGTEGKVVSTLFEVPSFISASRWATGSSTLELVAEATPRGRDYGKFCRLFVIWPGVK